MRNPATLTTRRLLAALACLLATALPAAAMRCGSQLVTIGDHAAEVLAKCGEPLTVDRWELLRQTSGFFRFKSWEQVVVEEWVYNQGSSRFMRVLRFENGRLVSEETAGKGFD